MSIADQLFASRAQYYRQHGNPPTLLIVHPDVLSKLESDFGVSFPSMVLNGEKRFAGMLIWESWALDKEHFYMGMEETFKFDLPFLP